MRDIFYAFLYTLGVHHFFRYFNGRSLTVLLYHGVAPETNQGIYNYKRKHISPEAFKEHLGFIARHYTVLPLDESFRMLRERTLPRHALAITFDDGYKNFYTYALPLLKEFRMPATIFVASDFVLKKKPLWVDRLEYAIGQKKLSREERIAEDLRLRAELKSLASRECERRLMPIEREIGATLYDFSDERAVYAPLNESEIKEMQEIGITIGGHTKSSCLAPTSFGCGSGRRDRGIQTSPRGAFRPDFQTILLPIWSVGFENGTTGHRGGIFRRTDDDRRSQRSGYAPFSFAPL